ncbi:hypothetical protein [Novosphingopyxis sp. YJ-S2-01]|uniref:hypothetical protein n=1 Tax=Novosphingopyxis sp. YJ-S2-01 TaxID=2794021 RepID=UPI0018DD114B|nr:hypothetical protein [Novosphingopyxis sp. YJ-S2-01]MBH9537532.1 hypothetical protein [Novosphingopyxis sp. YJ-S2-01]
MQHIALTGILKIELPEYTARLCDGGFITVDGDGTYLSEDPKFGAIASVESLGEGRGDEIPALQLELYPPDATPVGELSRPGYQRSRVTFAIVEYDVATGLPIAPPDQQFIGQIDQTSLRVGKARTLSMTIVSEMERLFELDIGNSLSPTFHQSVWPGELGQNNAAGIKRSVAWGTESVVSGSGYGGGGPYGGGARNFMPRMVSY